MKIIFFIFPFLVSIAVYSQVIPQSNIVEWEKAGCQYSFSEPQLVVNVMNYGAIANGITDDRQAVVDAIASLGGRYGIVYFPPGSYLLQSGISLPDSVVIRGGGSNASYIKINSTGSCFAIYGSYTGNFSKIISGFEKDSKKICVANASLFMAGDDVEIRQENGSWDSNPASWAVKVVGQISKITAIYGDTLLLEDKLRINFDTSLNLEIQKIIPRKHIRIECLNIERSNTSTSGTGYNIEFLYAINCRVQSIESNKSQGSHCMISYCSHIEVKGSFFHDAIMYDGAGTKGYGITLNSHSGLCLVVNNIFKHLRHAMMIKEGANGNVFAYNYSREPFRNGSFEYPQNYCGDISLHGHYSFANLFEGNIVQNIFIDQTWGPSGPYNTFFRNRAELYGIIMSSSFTNSQSFVGNEITGTGFTFPFSHGSYTITGNGHIQYGNNRNGSIIPTGTTTLNESSYYLTSPPLFWNITENWPDIGIGNTFNSGSIPSKNRYMTGLYTASCSEDTCVPPGMQATALNSTVINSNSISLSWIRGNGNAVLITAKQGTPVNAEPINGTLYTSDAGFGFGAQIGTGNYVVYKGADTSLNITGLIPENTYHFAIYEYNAASVCYKTPGAIDSVRFAALSTTFTATVSNEWENPTNWDHGVPGPYTNACISATKLAIVNSNNFKCKNLTVAPLGKLTINPGNDLTVSDTLTLLSDSTGTASLIDNGTLHTTTNIVERFIPHTFTDEFHMLSSPVASQPISPVFNQTNGFYLWNEPTAAWIEYADTSNFIAANLGTKFIQGKGYAVSYPTAVTKSFSGNLNTGSVNIPLTFTSGIYGGWNFIANPYPSGINWNAASGWNRTILSDADINEKAIWIWNPQAANYGAYISNAALGTNNVGRCIASAQGFWVKTDNTGVLSMNNEVREHADQVFLKSTATATDMLRLSVSGSANTFSDELILRFGNQHNGGGAEKMFSMEASAPAIYSTKLNKSWSINLLTTIADHPVIPIGFKPGVNGNYIISALGTESYGNVILEDLKTATQQLLSVQSSYSFNAQTTDDANRFLLHFSTSGVNDLPAKMPEIYYYKQSLTVYNPWMGKTVLNVYDVNGRLLQVFSIRKGKGSYNCELSKGLYIFKMMNNEKIFIKKEVIF